MRSFQQTKDTSGATREACDALASVVPRFTALVRSVPDAGARALGSWTIAEVAAHVSHVCAGELMAAYAVGSGPEEGLPVGPDLVEGVARFNAGNLELDQERDMSVIAARIEERWSEFQSAVTTAPQDETVSWLGGVKLPPSALAAHLLFEFLLHGYDIARAAGRSWPIKRPHAGLAFDFFCTLIRAADPSLSTSFVDPAAAAEINAGFDVRVRGGKRAFWIFDKGSLTLESPSGRAVDCHISADPVALLLVGFGRAGKLKSALTGRIVAWGRKPWLALKFNELMRTP